MPSLAWLGSRIRSTIFSPHSVGNVFTRKSMALVLDSFILIRPSWGTRRSEISSCAIIFTRAEILGASLMDGQEISFRTPSVRYRTRRSEEHTSELQSRPH